VVPEGVVDRISSSVGYVLAMRDRKTARHAWFVYVLRCGDGSLYTGIARDVDARLAMHESGKGARYTRGRGPLRLEAKTSCPSHGDALRVELALKKLPREEKAALTAKSGRLGRFARKVRASSDAARSAKVRPAKNDERLRRQRGVGE
jgi:putative endonuclease